MNPTPYWEGQVVGFASVRVLGRNVRVWMFQAILGIVTSIVDHFCWDWLNRFGFPLALFAIPLVSEACVILLFRWIDARWPNTEPIHNTLA